MEQKKPEAKKLERFDETLGFLETYLSRTTYSAADHLTIADFSIVASLMTAETIGHDLTRFPKVVSYLNKCKTEIKDYNKINDDALVAFKHFIDEALKTAK